MTNPFEQLKKPSKEDVEYDEWEGQFSCSTYRCDGWAKRAKFFPKHQLLVWQCEHGHTSRLEDVNE